VSGESANTSPSDILNFVTFCTGHQFLQEEPTETDLPRGVVFQTWIRHNSSQQLLSYLLLLPEPQFLHQVVTGHDIHKISPLCARRDSKVDALVLEFCLSEASRSIEKFRDLVKERVQGVSVAVVRLLSNQTLVNDHVRAFCIDSTGKRKQELDTLTESLSSELAHYLARPDVDQAKYDICLLSIVSIMPSARHVTAIMSCSSMCHNMYKTMIKCSRAFEQHRSIQMTVLVGNTPASMDFDDGFDSQSSQGKHQQVSLGIPRDSLSTKYDLSAFRRSLRSQLIFLACAIDTHQEQNEPTLPPNFLTHVLELTPEELCLSWSALHSILSSPMEIRSSDLTSLFEHITESFLANYQFERHESALSACLDMLIVFADRWLVQQDDGAGSMAQDMYEWFIQKALRSNIVSAHIETRIATLCFCLLELRGPEFRTSDSVPEVRDTILKFLDRDVSVQYDVANKLPTLFRHFTLGEHEVVLNSVWERLPIDPQQPERMGLRLHIFSRLAAGWHTLLRRGVYHIFETAGKFPSTKKFAAVGIKAIATALSVNNEREIFTLFASQLLFSWLVEQPVKSIPYTIFNYPSLDSLLHDVEDEIIAQVYMGSNEAALTELSQLLNKKGSDLLTSNFGRAAAYCFAQDSEHKRKGRQKDNLLESRLRAILGEGPYVRLFSSHYPQILAIIFTLVNGDMEEKLLKVFDTWKKSDFKYAQYALLEMRTLSESSLLLPPDQQPVFPSQGLLDSIYRVSKRCGRSLDHLWSPPVYVYVLRSLLQKMHPSLGSLHACSVLRKIRVLISLVGKTALSGYPLEMTLHALRPFLTDKQCSNDASGIVQHLLGSATSALVEAVPFVSGFLVSVLISLRDFVSLTQDSTTQERDYQATVKRASNFREWLVKTWYTNYASQIQCHSKEKSHFIAFKTLANAALGAQWSANAGSSTPESDLLRALLGQDKLSQRLLTKPSQRLTLNLLCKTFHSPSSYREDMFGTDSHSSAYAAEVWESCLGLDETNNQYLLWAGKVLGRARISTNWTFSVLSREDDIRLMEINWENEKDAFDFKRASKTVIVRALIHLLTSGNRNDVGLAEDTLREIMGKAAETGAIEGLATEIPIQITTALQFDTSTAAVQQASFSMKTLLQVLTASTNADEWVKDLAISIVSATDEPFLSPLVKVLQGVNGFAEKLLAPLVHLLLYEDFENPGETHKALLSTEISKRFSRITNETISHTKALLRVVLYLRQRPHPDAAPIRSWDAWLTLDPITAAKAAERCGMHTAALLFAEMTSAVSMARTTSQRRSTSQHISLESPRRIPQELLLSIYRSIEEPDSFYGVHQSTSLASVLQRLDYENDGFKALLFHSARLDSDMRQHRNLQSLDTYGVVQALSRLNLSSVSHAVLRGYQSYGGSSNVLDGALQAARKLEQWDISAPESSHSGSAVLFRVFQGINNALDLPSVRGVVDATITNVLQTALRPDHDSKALQDSLRTLGVLTEIDEVISSTSLADIKDVIVRMRSRDSSLSNAGYG